jgi:hypothetical protein
MPSAPARSAQREGADHHAGTNSGTPKPLYQGACFTGAQEARIISPAASQQAATVASACSGAPSAAAADDHDLRQQP